MAPVSCSRSGWLLVRRDDHWADEHDCPALAVLPEAAWHDMLDRARSELPAAGWLDGQPGGDEVRVSWQGGAAGWLAGFEACQLPAREGEELAAALGGACAALGPLCAPDQVRSWFLRGVSVLHAQSPAGEEPQAPDPDDPWCTLVFRDAARSGTPVGWLGMLPFRSWHAYVEAVHALMDHADPHGGVEASYGSNESIEYDSVREWLQRFRVIPCSDALARCLVPALGRHECVWEEGEDGTSMRDVLVPAWGLLPAPEGCWELLRQHGLPCPSMTCYAHGNAVGTCDACGAHAHRTSPPRPADPALVRLGRGLAAATRFHAPGRVLDLSDVDEEVDVIAWDPTCDLVTVRARSNGTLHRVRPHRVLSTALNGRRLDGLPLAQGVLSGLPTVPVWGWRRAG